jgi:branched-chain amino acid transport system substrate-binding protein
MLRGRRSSLGIAILAAGVILSACGSNKSETQKGADGGSDKTVKIGVIAPLSGSLTALGLGIKNGADLAVRQANEQQKIKGWKIVLAPEDDTAVPDVGANAATKLSDDKSVMGVVGSLNSSVAEKVAPILNSQHVVMISPANTNPTLSQGADPNNKARPFEYYFRVATTDLIQGPFAANYAYQTAGKRNVVVVHDKKTYGQGLALQFKAQFEKLGGKVPTVETIEPEDKDFSAVLSKIKRYNPDLIYFGGEYPAASLLTSQADQQGLKVPLMGGDGIFSGTFITVAKEAGAGDLATWARPRPSSTPTRPPATPTPTRPTAPTPTTPPTRSSTGWPRCSPARTRSPTSCGPSSARRSGTRRSTASPARWDSTSSATPPPASSPSTRSRRTRPATWPGSPRRRRNSSRAGSPQVDTGRCRAWFSSWSTERSSGPPSA